MSKVWRWEYHLELNGARSVMGGHVQTDLPSTVVDEPSAPTIASVVLAELQTDFRPVVHAAQTIVELSVRSEVLPESGDIAEVGSISINSLGTRVAVDQFVAPEICAVIRLRTAAATRSGRGWMFAPAALNNATQSTGGDWSAANAYWTSLQTFAAHLDNTMSTGGAFPVDVKPVVYSRTRRRRGQSYTFNVTSVNVDKHVHFLRSRRR